MIGNRSVFEVWRMVRHQHIMGFNGAVALNLEPVLNIVRSAGLAKELETVGLLQRVYGAVAKKIREIQPSN